MFKFKRFQLNDSTNFMRSRKQIRSNKYSPNWIDLFIGSVAHELYNDFDDNDNEDCGMGCGPPCGHCGWSCGCNQRYRCECVYKVDILCKECKGTAFNPAIFGERCLYCIGPKEDCELCQGSGLKD